MNKTLSGPLAHKYFGKTGGAASYAVRAVFFGYIAARKDIPNWLRVVSGAFAIEDAANTVFVLTR